VRSRDAPRVRSAIHCPASGRAGRAGAAHLRRRVGAPSCVAGGASRSLGASHRGLAHRALARRSLPAGARAAMKRRVVLYNPAAEFYTMPLALLAIGSHLNRERYEPVIVDGRLEPDPVGTVLQAAEHAVCPGVPVLSGGA